MSRSDDLSTTEWTDATGRTRYGVENKAESTVLRRPSIVTGPPAFYLSEMGDVEYKTRREGLCLFRTRRKALRLGRRAVRRTQRREWRLTMRHETRGPFAVVVKRFDEHEVWEKEERVTPESGGVDAVVEWSEDWPKHLATFTDSGDAIAYAATRGQRIEERSTELDPRRGPSACG